MRKIIEVDEAEGLQKLMGERVTLLCMNYFYTGKLMGVHDTCVLLEDPGIVYDTGAWDAKDWSDVQALPTKELYVSPAIASMIQTDTDMMREQLKVLSMPINAETGQNKFKNFNTWLQHVIDNVTFDIYCKSKEE